MSIAYVFAHFDDEFGAVPLILDAAREGRRQHFLYLADYETQAVSERRQAEAAAHLTELGVGHEPLHHVGRGSGVLDGAVHRGLQVLHPHALDRLRQAGPIRTLVTPAWEGGHADHDACAALTLRLAADLGVEEVLQFPLYNGAGLSWRFFRALRHLPRNGPVQRRPLTAAETLRWARGVRHFPSQLSTWIGLWPAMMLTLARHGWGLQRLTREHIRERPHDGPLYYERIFKVPYAEVRAATDAILRSDERPSRSG